MSARSSHPPGIFLVSSTEMWERFSYYGISALFVLFLTAPVTAGGFGWPAADAVWLYGLYAGLAFASPAIGGFIASGYLGERRCIALGGCAIMLGHILLGGPVYFPGLLGALTGTPVSEVLDNAGVTQGRLFADAELQAALAAAAIQLEAQARWALHAAYALRAWSFAAGLACVVIGTALIKPTISSIVDKLYAPDDPRRVFGFTLFMIGIWFGAFAANLVAGTLGERLGWHYGFMSAAVGMGIGIGTYFLLQHRLLGDIGRMPDRVHTGASVLRMFAATTPAERRRLLGLLAMSLFTVVYSIAFYQMFGLFTLFVQQFVDRSTGGFEVPATWFLSISTVAFMLFAPLIGAASTRRVRAGRALDAPTSLTFGLGAITCGYAVLVFAVAPDPAPVSLWWFVAAYACFGIGDIFIWPAQLALVTALAPRSMTALAVGSWYVTVGAGTYIAGVVGAWGERAGMHATVVRVLLLLIAALVLIQILRPWFAARCRPEQPVAAALTSQQAPAA